ncbi:alcohol dehydrogenase-like regulatory protein ErcA [Methanoregula sp.]|uniref:alcohol dehydrogenase-like regulatory protein ErcA n=1 Tax=Methanoregula sp. TaxID=2052170 RepID=UPI002BB06821|nr:alcohol dehydrogenase-like regulatory protein ErcA [Methanoregula sp.]HVP95546.1 alcohol dehydrogenase-like regulatory protein ErcA [Methanoregula sp.]
MSSLELRKFVAPELLVGVGARHLAGRYAKNFGTKNVLLVTDPGVKKTGLVDGICNDLQMAGIEYEIYSSVQPNPRVENVMQGAEIFSQAGCTALVAVGGGSVIDCAKGIGIVSSENRPITEFEGVDRITLPPPPLICIPTTAGSSADVSQFAIISDPVRKVKIAIISKALVPDVALIDPETLLTLPQDLTAYTGLDVLTHAIEAYVSNASSPLTDLHALEAIRLISRNLEPAVKSPHDLQLRVETMLASLYAGLAFSNASLGAVHAMAHSLGGFLDLPHGKCNALLLDCVMEYNYRSASRRYTDIGEALGLPVHTMAEEERCTAICQEIQRLRRSLGVTETLGSLGVTGDAIPVLADHAMKDACMATNPRNPLRQEIEALYESAL